MSEVDKVTEHLASTTVNDEKEVSFADKGLKLDTEEDAQIIVTAIAACPNMTTLCLEGNTVGVEASKAIAKALELQKCLRRALWKDMFTGRLKTEIPDALFYLSGGIQLAEAQLVELDLSDNAFGPVGIKGIVPLLKSEACKTLKVLRLNNNGLGITGGKHLAQALQANIDSNIQGSRKFALKTFICGRNRLENDGAKVIADVLQQLGSLEEVAMPQNGIYHEGVSALAEAFSSNPHLKVINLNDNIFTEIGAKAFAKNLVSLHEIEVINFGDCLIKTGGAMALADALKEGHTNLKELHLGFNEISHSGGIAITDAIRNKIGLQKLELNGNAFGLEGCEMIERAMEAIGFSDQLGTLSDDEGEGDEDEGDEEDEEVSYDDDDEALRYFYDVEESSFKTVNELDNYEGGQKVNTAAEVTSEKSVSVVDFLERPNLSNLVNLGNDRVESLMAQIGETPSFDCLLAYFILVSCTLSLTCDDKDKRIAFDCCDAILKCAFNRVNVEFPVTYLTNDLLAHLGLIKSEDKKLKTPSDLTGPFIALEHCVKQPYFSKTTKETLQFFLSQPKKAVDSSGRTKHILMQTLFTS